MASISLLEPRQSPPADERRTARLRIFELLRSAQLDGDVSTAMAAEIVEDAESRGWADVAKLGMFLGIFCERFLERGSGETWIERLLRRAEDEGDPVMAALALASRAQDLSTSGGRAWVDADRDLARATALLESWSGPSSEAVSAHIECAYAYEARDLWELQLRHCRAAEACVDPNEGADERLEVLLYNRAEAEVTWLVALREHGCRPELAERADHARQALAEADLPAMPDGWREDLHIFREFVDAISAPRDPGRARDGSTRPAEGQYAGMIHLTRALLADDPRAALAHCERAIEAIDPDATRRLHLFSLALAVELESAQAGHETAGLRWGRELVARRWERRLASLASVESLLDVERRAAEHALLRQHAYLDDLTGLANRRALARYVDGLRGRNLSGVTVALVDLDHFKSINDGHGHAVGDEVLVRIASILRAAVREQSLVARLGGDEFLLVLEMDDLATATRRCETISAAIAGDDWGALAVTASIGVACGRPDDFESLTAAADAALYRAKQVGGARVAI